MAFVYSLWYGCVHLSTGQINQAERELRRASRDQRDPTRRHGWACAEATHVRVHPELIGRASPKATERVPRWSDAMLDHAIRPAHGTTGAMITSGVAFVLATVVALFLVAAFAQPAA